ncbi:hypothetical protein FOXB_03249 [Fusarium oxysporum f. sp. conglutinans Fo5176]|uniref:Xylanolytic transcriptional activator regulatory domain-containing protein n=1 Tax=Fusarium oxysporum (strain Fo5176) TaxID=660025 RepID=F9FA24_FUSOF|nr:hypothetical protein FOXB_03249 [Fusarium oxysporum f. sp. conglutinans Fo5176]
MDHQQTPEKMLEKQSVSTPKKRNAADTESNAETTVTGRSKRGKYTSVACCERCIAGGLTCTFATSAAQVAKAKPEEGQHIQALNHQLSQLLQQVSDLVGVVRELKEKHQEASTVSSHPWDSIVTPSPASTHREEVPKQPQFVGPTRSAFGFLVSERSLNRMGIPKFDSLPPSGAQSPSEFVNDGPVSDLSFWDRCTPGDVTRYLVIFQEEVELVYPFIDISEHIAKSKEILHAIQSGRLGSEDDTSGSTLRSKDIALAKVAMATGMVLEETSKIELSTAIVNSVETNVSSILSSQVDLKEIQLLTMLSIYYFHSGEELLAWRSIGIAAREALEMGLHQKRSLFDNFKDSDSRRLATRVFWCVYVLDRRWSFGTSLSFALVDKDVDPELPKPCMVGYGQLCSKIWEAIPPFGSASQTIPDETAAALDLCTQDWLDSIPPHLRLRHPRLGLASRAQPRLPHRLRALLYLRGNYVRILIYRHHLMSTASIAANPQNAWLVVDIAQDSIHVLVHLHATTDIYSRQQNAFNYFLLSALAVIFLAVCHAPEIFSVPCRRILSEGVDLVRGLSRHSIVSKRLWRSIRGMIPRMKTFGFPHSNCEESDGQKYGGSGTTDTQNHITEPATDMDEQMPMTITDNEVFPFGDMTMPEADLASSIPDMFQMRDDLLDLFDAFGQGHQFLQPVPGTFREEGEFSMANYQGKDISMRFQGLI